jgi:1,2-phenylacetyl-CoA epoxidase PaaB subunit
MKKTILKTMLAVVLISLFVIPFAYSAGPNPPKDKIFFTWAPGAHVGYFGPPNTDIDAMMVWVACVTDSTYGPFTLVLVEYGRDYFSGPVIHYEDHWYTTNLEAGKTYAALTVKVYTTATEVYDSWDVTQATITTNQPSQQADYLSVTVKPKGKPPFTVQYWADTSQPIRRELVSRWSAVAPELFHATRAWRPNANAAVTGIKVGDLYVLAKYVYWQTELYDPSLLS